MDVLIAWRNIFRNRRRTAFSLAVIVLGVAILFVVLAFIGEALQSTRDSIACEIGGVQVADPRLFAATERAYDVLIIPEILEQVAAWAQADPRVADLSWQLSFAGLIGDQEGSTLLVGRGIVPCTCTANYECLLIEGESVGTDDDAQIVLGRALAEKLGAQSGDRLNIATGTVSGSFNAATVEVIGLLEYSVEEVEAQLGLMSVPFVQRLLRTDGVERILFGLTDLDDADAFAADLQGFLDASGIPLEAQTWEQLSSEYQSIAGFYGAFSGLSGIAIFALVFFSTLEILTMSFLERTRETGTLRALGTGRPRVFRTFLLEGILLGVFGGACGAALGVALALVFNAIGVGWMPPGAAMPQTLRLQVDAMIVLVPLLTAIGSTAIASIYPATKNARLPVVDALRSV